MQRGKKLIFLVLFLLILTAGTASQKIGISTDHNSLNADGDEIRLDYSEINRSKINKLEITEVNTDTILATLEQPKNRININYSGDINNTNLTLNYDKNGSTHTQNIKQNLIRYQAQFSGVFKEDKGRITRQAYYRELDDLEIKINVNKTDGNQVTQSKGLLGKDFIIKGKNTTADLELVGNSRNPYTFRFSSIPRMKVGKKDFVLKMKQGPEIKEFAIEKRAAFEGKILTKKGNGQEASFELVDDSISKFETDKNGYFFKLLESGSVDRKLKLDLGEVTTTFNDIKVNTSEQENIRYEFYKGLDPSEVETKKLIRPVNLIAFSSNYPININKTTITMNYNTSKINPKKIQVYECKYWDFFGEECRRDWERKHNINNKELLGKVTIKDLETEGNGDYGLKSAYMAAVPYSRPSLKLKNPLEISKTEYNIDEELIIDGTIINNKTRKPVIDSKVSVTVSNNRNESISLQKDVQTSKEGYFSFPPLDIPDSSGIYALQLSAYKDSYNNLTTTHSQSIKITKRKEIKLKSTEKEMKPGERVTAVLSIENLGQAPIKNIKVVENNIKNKHYTLTPQEIDQIPPGGSKTVTIMSILPKDYCTKNNCDDKTFNIAVKGESEGTTLNDESEITILNEETKKDLEEEDNETTEQASQQTDQEQETSKNSGEKNTTIENITGNFTKLETDPKVILLGFLVVSLIILLVLVRKKKRGNSGRGKKSKLNIAKEKLANSTNKLKNLRSDASEVEEISDKDREKEIDSHKSHSIEIDKNKSVERFSKPPINSAESSRNTRATSSEDIYDNRKNEKKERGKESNERYYCLDCGERFDTEIAFNLHLDHHH